MPDLPRWTPNYSGAGYVQILEWRPEGAYSIEVDYLIRAPNGGNAPVITVDHSNATLTDLYGIYQNSDGESVWVGAAYDERFINGVMVSGNNVYTTPYEGVIQIRVRRNSAPLAGYTTIGDNIPVRIEGQISSLRLTDLDTPSNSRYYPSTISSETQPTTLTLVDELGDGTTDGTLTNFPAGQEWTEVITV